VFVCVSMVYMVYIYICIYIYIYRELEAARARGGGVGGLRFLVYTPGSEGWGNRALVLAGVVLAALQTQRLLIVDWSGSPPLQEAFAPMPFIWRWDTGGGGGGGGGEDWGGGGGEGPGSRTYQEFLGWGVGKPWVEVDVACAVSGREGPVGVAAGLMCDDNPSFTEVFFYHHYFSD
jgi:hypothetical protein